VWYTCWYIIYRKIEAKMTETDWDSIIGVPDVSTERWEELMDI